MQNDIVNGISSLDGQVVHLEYSGTYIVEIIRKDIDASRSQEWLFIKQFY